ncbi:neurexin-4-like [Amphiura filiformis]|uniref:neurexin-4-like n=1 Tax=Amphiura filiformis TaxID=82378 RepID=UPI003B212345
MATGTTRVHHNKETTKEISGFEQPGSYVLDITYEVSMPQIIALTDISANCKQRIKLRCWMAAMWFNGVLHSWWVSRDNQKMENWGTPTGTSGCPCGQVGDCGLYKCDCDWNLIQWNQDEGELTDKSTLPVKQLRLGETGSLGEKVQYTVGSLECNG